jgi:hypothetical protein
MIYKCEELDRDFDNKKDLFKALRTNATKLIDVKKSNIFKSSEKGSAVKQTILPSVIDETTKAELNFKDGNIYPVINTIGFLDSHNDVHIKGIWNKSVKEQTGKIHYVADHDLSISNIICWKSDVKMLIKDIDWQSVGKPYAGQTQALIFEIPESKIRLDVAKQMIQEKLDVENSVRMRYMDIKLCYNSDAEEDKEFKKNYDKYYPQIVNKDDYENITYFYAVLQAMIVDEGSMVVNGSNSATRVLQTKDIEPSADTHKKSEEADNSHEVTTEHELNIYNFN